MKHNGHRNRVRPQKVGLDRTNWCKYGYSFGIYDSIEKALIEAKVVTAFGEPGLQDKDRNPVEFESKAYGYKVTSKIS